MSDGLARAGGSYVQNVVGSADFLKPENYLEVSRRWGNGVTLTLLMNSIKRYRGIARENWRRYEEGQYHRTFSVANDVAAGAAGASVAVQLHADDLDANNQFYPRRGYQTAVALADGTIAVLIIDNIVQAGAVVTLTLTPFVSTVAIPAISADTELAIIGHAKAIGTDQPDPSRYTHIARDYNLQVIAETMSSDGGVITDQTWFTKFDDGKKIVNMFSHEFDRADMLMDMYQDSMAFVGQINSNNITQTANNMNSQNSNKGIGNSINTSRGMFDWGNQLGGRVDYTTGSWTLADLDSQEDHYRSQGVVSGNILHLVGSNLKSQIDTACQDEAQRLDSGDIFTGVVNRYFGGSKSMSISLGFSVIKRTNFTHIFQTIDSFDNPWFLGVSGLRMNERGISFPIADVETMDENKKKVMLPNVSFCYKELNGYSRKREAWREGAAGMGMYLEKYTGQTDALDVYWRSHIGLEALKMNQVVMTHPV